MNGRSLYPQKYHDKNAIIGGILFLIFSIIAFIGVIALVVVYSKLYNEAVNQISSQLSNPDEKIKELKFEYLKTVIITSILGFLSTFVYFLIGISLTIENERFCRIMFGVLTLLSVITLLASMISGIYENLLALMSDLILVGCIGRIWGMFVDATRVSRSYTPPKGRYIPFIASILFTIIGASAQGGEVYKGYILLGVIIGEVFVMLGILCAMKFILKPSKVYEIPDKNATPVVNLSEKLSGIKPIKKVDSEELKKYEQMYKSGVLSKEEYEIKKKELE